MVRADGGGGSVAPVAGFLSDTWFDDLTAAARTARGPDGVRLVVQQVVTDGDDEVAYALELRDGAIVVHRGRVDHPDISFTQDRATALAIHRGELAAQAAFMDGRLRLGGDLRAAMQGLGALAAVDDLFASTRA